MTDDAHAVLPEDNPANHEPAIRACCEMRSVPPPTANRREARSPGAAWVLVGAAAIGPLSSSRGAQESRRGLGSCWLSGSRYRGLSEPG